MINRIVKIIDYRLEYLLVCSSYLTRLCSPYCDSSTKKKLQNQRQLGEQDFL
jgi:hypothetical protein